ncbi:MAG: beta-ketoacyl-ACP synthase III, partial [Oricola sp.]
MQTVSISGTGVFTPEQTISNAELVAAFNAWADRQNALHAEEIARGEREPVPHSDEGFIVKASGIESRYVLDKTGTLDPEIMHPVLRERSDEELSAMAEMALAAAGIALKQAGRTAKEIDAVICAASNHE